MGCPFEEMLEAAARKQKLKARRKDVLFLFLCYLY